jgi:hypothetical protein
MNTLRAPFPWFGVPANVATKIRLGDTFADLGPCWEWTAAKTSGYGVVQHDGRIQRAHRVVYAALVGPVPHELELDHLCRNRACVNPAHAEPVTGAVNNARSESASAKHARQTHCLRGHEFTPGNTYTRKRAHKTERFCRACMRDRDRQRYARKTGRAEA